MPDVSLVPETLTADAAPFGVRDFAGADAARCNCPMCMGGVQVIEIEGQAQIQGYLNADERAGAVISGKQSFTIDRAALQLTGFRDIGGTLVPERGWSSAAGQPFTVTYGFRASQPFDMPSDTAGFSRFNATQILQAEQALVAWADVANITFVRVGAGTDGEGAFSDNAAILFANYSSGESGASAFSYFPGSTNPSSSAGDVWVNTSITANRFPTGSNTGGHVLVHEIGHAIGLAHPGSYDSTDGGGPISYAGDAEYYEDTRQYSVMSYFNEANTGGNFGGRYPSAPMLDDIAAAQVEYGANMSTRLGDTTYGFNSTAGRDFFLATSSGSRLIFAVWDAGGQDTFDFSGYSQSQMIDLREGNFSNVGGLVGNVAVAKNARIENAIGGSGADTLRGNALDNVLEGRAGSDTIYGGAGADRIDGGTGSSFLRGEDGNDTLIGGSVFDDLHGNKGDDSLQGGEGDDWVVGGQGSDALVGGAGNDVVLGNLGDDILYGLEGDDVVRGGQGSDVLVAGPGADFVSGDRGDDTLTGGEGADNFHTFSGAGLDRVLDFNAAEGDYVSFAPGTTYAVSQGGEGVVIAMAEAGDMMILVGVQLASLPSGWLLPPS